MDKKCIKQRMKLSDIQANLDTLKPIHFNLNEKYNFKDITDILKFATNSSYNINNTTYMGKRKQCPRQRKRGISDLYRLCKYYFPETTLENVVKAIKSTSMQRSYCCTTNQDVFRYYNDKFDDDESHYQYTRVMAVKNDPSIRLKTRKRVYIDYDS